MREEDKMAKLSIAFSGVDFGQVSGVFGATVAGELGYYDIATDAKADFDNNTMTCSAPKKSQISEIISSLIVAMIGEFPSFEMDGDAADRMHFSVKYDGGALSVRKTLDGSESSAVYQLEDGMFNDEDGDAFALFFNL